LKSILCIVQKKALTPNDFADLQAVEKRLLDFQNRYQEIARPFSWNFTRKDLKEKIKLVGNHIINQHQAAVPQASITEELDSWDEIPETASVYAYT
jgi:hypothetical protein